MRIAPPRCSGIGVPWIRSVEIQCRQPAKHARPSRSRPRLTPATPVRRFRPHDDARRTGAKIPKRQSTMVLAIRLSINADLPRSENEFDVSASSPRLNHEQRHPCCRPRVRSHQEGQFTHVPPFFRNSPVSRWIRHSHSSRTTRPQGRQNNDDLHARSESWQARR